jgi:hypothetical protein
MLESPRSTVPARVGEGSTISSEPGRDLAGSRTDRCWLGFTMAGLTGKKVPAELTTSLACRPAHRKQRDHTRRGRGQGPGFGGPRGRRGTIRAGEGLARTRDCACKTPCPIRTFPLLSAETKPQSHQHHRATRRGTGYPFSWPPASKPMRPPSATLSDRCGRAGGHHVGVARPNSALLAASSGNRGSPSHKPQRRSALHPPPSRALNTISLPKLTLAASDNWEGKTTSPVAIVRRPVQPRQGSLALWSGREERDGRVGEQPR